LNSTDLTYLLNKPEAINDVQTASLEAVMQQFPYFQAARALYLKGLYNNQNFRYNYELKKTAAYTTDRSILFDFITSEKFSTLQKQNIEQQLNAIEEISVSESEWVNPETQKNETAVTDISSNSEELKEENHTENIALIIEKEDVSIEEHLQIGKPFNFNQSEKHSFNEWLQLTKIAPIERNEEQKTPEIDVEKSKKFDLIDKFIEANPKIIPTKENTPSALNIGKSIEEPTHLMTETLAQIYLEQKKYQRAIQAYEILILKYPEKSSFFADRIDSIKKLQQNNNN